MTERGDLIMMNVKTEWVTLDVGGKPMSAYVASPEAEGNYPPVLVFMEIFGVNDHIQDVTRRIAQEGYVVLAPDYYHRIAPNLNLSYTMADIEEGKRCKDLVSHEDMLNDAQAAITYLQSLPNVRPKEKIGTIGFCFGGYVAYVVSTLPEVAATASFYGAGLASDLPGKEEPPVDKSEKIQGFMLCMFGEKDASIPQEDIRMVESSLARAHIPHQVIVYPDADHGFFCDKRGSYNPEAAFEAWQEVKRLFATQLKGVGVS
jgi:carboxymethylenebutenolidase